MGTTGTYDCFSFTTHIHSFCYFQAMFSSLLILCAYSLVYPASSSLFITFPVKGSACAVQQPCQIKWMDSSASPSTSSLGETSVDLVTGDSADLQKVQDLGGVSNPSIATALTFMPAASLSRNAQYAIRFTSRKASSTPIFFYLLLNHRGSRHSR